MVVLYLTNHTRHDHWIKMFDVPTTVQCMSLNKHVNRVIYITITAVIDSVCSWIMSAWYSMKTHIFKRGITDGDHIRYHCLRFERVVYLVKCRAINSIQFKWFKWSSLTKVRQRDKLFDAHGYRLSPLPPPKLGLGFKCDFENWKNKHNFPWKKNRVYCFKSGIKL